MRVLLLHNRYRAEGGEERAVRDIASLLQRRGHQVQLLERSSRELGRAQAGRALLLGGENSAQVSDAARRLGADVVHAHNLHPLFGWRALAAARDAGARTVVHLHNFRLFCAIAVAYRDGAPCYSCRGANTFPGLRYRCRDSLPEAAAYALGLSTQQRRIYAHTDRFVVLSAAHGARLHELGLPSRQTVALPNFVPEARFAATSRADQGDYALVAGRLVEEKGFDTAVAAATAAGIPLVVAGDGPDRGRLGELAGSAVRFTGWLEQAAMDQLRQRAAVVLVPSRCEEACPYAVLDSLAAGIPTFVSDRGGLPELVGGDYVLPAEDPAAWAAALAEYWSDRPGRRARGEAVLASARERLGEERYYEELLRIYARD